MKDVCSTYRDCLVDLAEGNANTEVARHIEGCSKCFALVQSYREILVAAHHVWEEAPSNLIAQVKGMIPERRRIHFGRRLGGSIYAGARGPTEEFQLVVGEGEISVRLMATPVPIGWSIMGRLPNENWSVEGPVNVELNESRFQFDIQNLENSAFDLVGPDDVLHVPALSELICNDGI